jgi:triacylglycerol lipase
MLSSSVQTWHLLALLSLVAALVGGVYAIWRWKWRWPWRFRPLPFRSLPFRSRRALPEKPTPVVLTHGILGFDELKLGGKRTHYFRGVAERLRALGTEVHVVRLPPAGSIAARAETLADSVRGLPVSRVNVIAHSMGGLDARYAISRLGLHERVASLVTIATPHWGTPLADLGAGLLGDKLGLRWLVDALGGSVEAFYDLTTERMHRFNEEVPDCQGVKYACFVASCPSSVRRLNPLLVPAFMYLSQRIGENDGMVPASSQVWGEVWGAIEADHWAQIGWSPHFDAPEFYAKLLHVLRERGY